MEGRKAEGETGAVGHRDQKVVKAESVSTSEKAFIPPENRSVLGKEHVC